MNQIYDHYNKAGDFVGSCKRDNAEDAIIWGLDKFDEMTKIVEHDTDKVVSEPPEPHGMTFAIKNLKYMASHSEETHCFTATLYIDGKRFCEVRNAGHGGSDDYWAVKNGQTQNELWAEIRRINEILDKDLHFAGRRQDGSFYSGGGSLESEVCELVNQQLRIREVKSHLRKILYYKGDDTSKLWSVKAKPTAVNIAAVKEASWWKDTFQIINELSMEQVLELDFFKG